MAHPTGRHGWMNEYGSIPVLIVIPQQDLELTVQTK